MVRLGYINGAYLDPPREFSGRFYHTIPRDWPDTSFYAFTGHKLYGPTGIGALYGKYEHLVAMPPFNGGGEMIHEVFEDRITSASLAQIRRQVRRRSCRRSGSARRRLCQLGARRASERMKVRWSNMPEQLGKINSLRIIGKAPDKGPIVSFEMKGAHPHDVASIIDRGGVAVRAGTHCVMPLLARYGLIATCRASFAMYNTRDEVDTLAASLVKAQEFFV
jgi:cysteine desulfurase/selenocysteine lyase